MASASVEGYDSLMQHLNYIPAAIRSSVEKAVIIAGSMIETTAKDNIRQNDGIVTGNLFQSVGTTLKSEEDQVVALTGSTVGYAPAYEFGMSVSEGDFNTPEFERAILEWVHIKGFAAGEDEEQVARAIVEHIRRVGTKPHPFLIPAYQQHMVEIKALLERAITAGVRNVP